MLFPYLGLNLRTDSLLSTCVGSPDEATDESSGNDNNDTDSTHSINELSSAASAALRLCPHNSLLMRHKQDGLRNKIKSNATATAVYKYFINNNMQR